MSLIESEIQFRINCRIIRWQDLGRKDLGDWDLEITFVKEMDYWNSGLVNNLIDDDDNILVDQDDNILIWE